MLVAEWPRELEFGLPQTLWPRTLPSIPAHWQVVLKVSLRVTSDGLNPAVIDEVCGPLFFLKRFLETEKATKLA